jgi:outer membrane protein TolC
MRTAAFLSGMILALAAVSTPAEDLVLSISLEEAEARALASSPELTLLRLHSRRAARDWALGIRDYLPQLSVGFDDSRLVVTGGPDTSRTSFSATVVQPLFDGGRTATRRAIARASLALEQRTLAESEDALLDEVRTLSRQALVNRQKLRIQEEVRAITSRELEICRTELRIGAAREIDLVEAELEDARAGLTLEDTRAALEQGMDRLGERLGMRPGDRLELSGSIDTAYQGLELPAEAGELVPVALANNASLKRRGLEARQALEELRAVRRQFVPRISLEIAASVSGERFPLQDPSVSAKLLFDVPSPAFPATASLAAGNVGPGEKSGGTSVDVAVLQDLAAGFPAQAAALSREESRLRKLQAEQQLASQVRRALAACAQKKAAAAVQRRTVELGQRKARILARAVDLGGAKRVDSMAAQTQLARDAGALLEAVLSLLEAERELERLLGLRPGELAALARTPLAQLGCGEVRR